MSNVKLVPCKPSNGYTVLKWANQYGEGCKGRYLSSNLHARINRRVGLRLSSVKTIYGQDYLN